MRRLTFLLRVIAPLFLVSGIARAQAAPTDSFDAPGFGKINLYEPKGAPTAVVLFLSGDGGWEPRVMDMADALRQKGALVAGVNTPHYLKAEAAAKEKTFYPAGDFEELSKAVQKRANLPAYLAPVLAGYSSGATLIYVLLAQAPTGTYAGGISLGFCPALEFSKQPSAGKGLKSHRVTKPVAAWLLEPDPALATPWYALHGQADECCSFAATRQFTRQISQAHLVALPKVGHGYAATKNWMPQFKDAFEHLAQNAPVALAASKPGRAEAVADTDDNPSPAPAPSLSDLPLKATEAKAGSAVCDRMVVFLSGDGGWNDFDQSICDDLAAKGMPVVGLNTLKYFWKERTPEGAAWDLSRIITEYGQKWGKKEVVLAGYSYGAEVLPFMFNRLSDEQKKLVKAMLLLSPDEKTDFTFHVSFWLNKSSIGTKPVKPELEKMQQCRTLFIYGSDEDPSWVRPLAKGNFELKILNGGHHYGKDTAAVSAAMLVFLK